MRKKKYTMGLCAVLLMILILTLLPPNQTWALSEWARKWFVALGFSPDALQFRSDLHLVEYFVLGVAFTFFGRSMGWQKWLVIAAGFATGLLDEILKIFLPTREFGFEDLVKDFLGIVMAFVLINSIIKIKQSHLTEKHGSKQKTK